MQVLKENFIDRRRLGWRLFWSVLSVFSLAIAQAQNSREQEIAQAREKYYQGEFDAAIDMLNRCMRQNDLTEAQKVQAHKSLAQAYFAKDYFDEAATHVQKMIELESEYRTDPVQDPPSFVEFVKKAKSQMCRDGRFMVIKARHLALLLGNNFSPAMSKPLRVVSGNFTFHDMPISSSFLYLFQKGLEGELNQSSKFKMVKRSDLQAAVKTRGIAVTARLKPSTPVAMQEFVEADAVLLGNCWDKGDSLAIHVTLVDSVKQIVFSSATTRFAKDDIAETTPALPNNFAQAQATMTAWSESAAPASKLNLKLWVDRLDGAVYQKGEKMTAYIRADKDCYLYLFYHDAGGNDFLIFPNRLRPNHQITGGKVYEIPSRADQFDFTIVAPLGVEILKAFASNQPLPELQGKAISGGIKKLKLSAADLAKTLRGIEMKKRPDNAAAGETQIERAEASCVVTTVEK